MPAHNGIHIALISQYDAMHVPEYCPPADDETNKDENNDNKNAASHHIDTYIPNHAASQFWIRYACGAADQGPATRFYYFKLYVAGKFAVAWGCGAQDGCMGETLFVPNDVRSAEAAPREKLGLFSPRDSEIQNPAETPSFEIRVHRARARKRQERQYADIDPTQGAQGSVHLNAIGIVERGDPRRFYTYALLDPKDEPYVCFRYHFRTYGDLQDRGFVRQRGIRIILPMQVKYRGFTDPFDNAHDHVSVAESSTPRQNFSPRQSTIRIVEEDEEE